MMRLPLILTGVLTVSLIGCFDRGGLEPTETGGQGGPDAGGGGHVSSGGASGTGGVEASGGSPGTGGVAATGGHVGTGGITATGGSPGTGGTGGIKGTGGTGGIKGTGGAGGIKGTGGAGGKKGTGGAGGSVMCGPVCDIYCANGHVLDANGCETCACKPTVCPAIACLVACTNGYTKDANGCSTCTCNTNPQACATADCGLMPSAPYTTVCTTSASGTSAGASADLAPVAPPLVCQRNTAGTCIWQLGGCRVCPTLTCTVACTTGQKVAADGCPTCACAN